MYKLAFCLIIGWSGVFAQKSITISHNGLGINPISSFKTITETGKIVTGNARDLKPRTDSTLKNNNIESTAHNDVRPIFLLIDSILSLQNKVDPNPSLCGSYGLQKIIYNSGVNKKLLFCLPDFSAYEAIARQIKKEKKKPVKQQLTLKLKNAQKLFALYKTLSIQINRIY